MLFWCYHLCSPKKFWVIFRLCSDMLYTQQPIFHRKSKFCHINFCQSRKIGFRSRQWKGQLLGKRNHFLHMAPALMTASQVSVVKTSLVHIIVSWVEKFWILISHRIILLKFAQTKFRFSDFHQITIYQLTIQKFTINFYSFSWKSDSNDRMA